MDCLKERILTLNPSAAMNETGTCVIYDMSRDIRVADNFALLAAQKTALKYGVPLIVFFNIFTQLEDRNKQQFLFMIEGLKEVKMDLEKLGISFIIRSGNHRENSKALDNELQPITWFYDYSPLRYMREHTEKAPALLGKKCFVVDSHNIVPVWLASPKQEWAAYTFRPKITKLLPNWLQESEQVIYHSHILKILPQIDSWEHITSSITAPNAIGYQPRLIAGSKAAIQMLDLFLSQKLNKYTTLRNDPTEDCQSDMSPYLRFGFIWSGRVALAVQQVDVLQTDKDAFLEELIVRRELAENYCHYNTNYDNFEGLAPWAKTTLLKHASDKREYVYSKDDFEHGLIHDYAWNAAQKQLTTTGKMHGYMRMYWAKKILEWTKTPEEAIEIALYLNDKYELDGMEPSGYVGVLWSIGGLHDRPWIERPIFGQVRYMNYAGLKRKFDIEAYIAQWNI
jgi:deoxyribodipyrimidine photo-lyase